MRALASLLALLVSGCNALSPDTEVLRGARNLSPETRVSAGRDLNADVEAALAKALAGRDQEIKAAFADVSKRIVAGEGAHVSQPQINQGLDGWDFTLALCGAIVSVFVMQMGMMAFNRWSKQRFGPNGEHRGSTEKPP